MKNKLIAGIALLAIACAGHSACAQTAPLPRPDHVVIVMEENHAYNQVIGSASAPYINALAQSGALFTQSFAIEHPSEPNYLDLFSGTNQGVTDDSCPHSFSTDNLGNELLGDGLTFMGYAESLPAAGSTVCDSYPYARRHVPWVNFTNVPASDNQPFSSFPTDYTTLPTVSIVVPNVLDDMHDGTIAQGDTWLQQNMDSYAQWAKTHNSLLIVTWDEDDDGLANQIATLFVGQMVNPGQDAEPINHFSVLRTVEDMYGLPHAGSAQMATPITDVWTTANTHLLWNNVSGEAALSTVKPDGTFTSVSYGPFSGWTARAVASAPNSPDWLLWTNTNGTASLWNVTSSGYTATQFGPYSGFTAVSLSIASSGDPQLLWNETNGTASLWDVNKSTGAFTHTEYGPFPGWTANQVASGATVTDLLWTNTNGTAAGWRIAANGTLTTSAFGPYSGYGAVGLSVGPDDGAHLLWDSTSGSEALWSADFATGAFTATSYGPLSGWATKAIATGPDNGTRMLWDNTNGEASLWDITGSGYTHTEYGPFAGWTAVGVSAGP